MPGAHGTTPEFSFPPSHPHADRTKCLKELSNVNAAINASLARSLFQNADEYEYNASLSYWLAVLLLLSDDVWTSLPAAICRRQILLPFH